jgi:FemAB-related protein (PEP-CTERM system-associated)
MLLRRPPGPGNSFQPGADIGSCPPTVLGLLPSVHLNHPIFGNTLVSLPFLDTGGIVADSEFVQEKLLDGVIKLGQRIGARTIELRHQTPLQSCKEFDAITMRDVSGQALPTVVTRTNKVRMLLPLPSSSETLMRSFKSKLRSQVNKSLTVGFVCRIGGLELLRDFYHVFSVNMRDLGSPVHSMRVMQYTLVEFPEKARIVVVYSGRQPVAAALVVGFKNVLSNPWASSLRSYAAQGANMFLYWQLLSYACQVGYDVFDFGRSSPGEGTYKFKEQWGAVPSPLYWHSIYLDETKRYAENNVGGPIFAMARRCWTKLPVAITKVIGPHLRKHISL